MPLKFREVTEKNFDEFIELEVKPEQKDNFYFKRSKPNLWTLAQGYVYHPHSKVLAIYDGNTMVGSVFYSPKAGPPGARKAWLIRFMIDQRYQGRGLGKQAMELLFERVLKENGGKKVRLGLSYEPHNKGAEKLYTSLGFVPSGEVLERQIVVWRDIE